MSTRTVLIVLLALCPTLTAEASPSEEEASADDPVTLSFAFVGCNRVGWSAVDGVPLPPSTANAPQLLQTFEDVAGLAASRGRAVDYFFFLGDLVRNESSAKTLAAQLEGWQSLVDQSALAGATTRLVPIVGNHEVLKSVEYADHDYYEVPAVGTPGAWTRWLIAHDHPPQSGSPIAPNGPTPTSSRDDLLQGDNSHLSYSFDVTTSAGQDIHFLLLDTDTHSTYASSDADCYQPPQQTVTFEGHPVPGTMSLEVPGWVPSQWATSDLRSAGDSDLLFAFGHKPLVAQGGSPDTPSTGRDTVFNCGDQMRAEGLIDAFASTDGFVAYLTAHQHLWDAFEIEASERSVWQIIAGDGGSPLSGGDTFGFTLVEVHASGKVVATRFDRPAPSPVYYTSDGVGPARPAKVLILSP